MGWAFIAYMDEAVIVLGDAQKMLVGGQLDIVMTCYTHGGSLGWL